MDKDCRYVVVTAGKRLGLLKVLAPFRKDLEDARRDRGAHRTYPMAETAIYKIGAMLVPEFVEGAQIGRGGKDE